MINEWIILKNIIFGYDKNFKLSNIQINKILLFDLDNTLIKTKSGRVFPIDSNDWEFLHQNILIINELYKNNICGIITNQLGLKNQNLINNWIDKIKQINKLLNFHFVFVSISNDNFRKPLPSSWDYINTNYLSGIDIKSFIKSKKIYYIGDAFGRPKDHSDTDIKYAINCGFKFKTPEAFFNFNKIPENLTGNITYPLVTYYDKEEQEKLFNQIFNYIKTGDKIIIVMIGFPASGKSFLRKEIIKKYPDFKYTNNDDLNDKITDDNLVKSNQLEKYNYCIEDNTNLSTKSRKNIIDKYSDYKKIGIWFNYDMDTYKHLNYMRMYWFGTKLINQIIYRTLNKSYIVPEVFEGFDVVIEINKVFHNFDYDNKIKYYF